MNKLIALLPPTLPPPQPTHGTTPAKTTATSTTLHGWAMHDDGNVQPASLTLEAIAHNAPGELIITVPVNALSWHPTTLPAALRLRGDARLLPVLQNLLEDTLLDDAERLHIALPPDATPGQPCALAACDRAWLAAWLHRLEQAGLKVGRVIPLVPPDLPLLHTSAAADQSTAATPGCAIPTDTATPATGSPAPLHGICTGTPHNAWATIVREGVPISLALVPESAAALHQLSTTSAEADTDPTTATTSSATIAFAALPSAYSDATRSLGNTPVQLLTEQDFITALLDTRWSLAQHSFALGPLERTRRQWRTLLQDILHAPRWQPARLGAIALSTAVLAGLYGHWWAHTRALQAGQQAIQTTARQAFPQLHTLIDPPLQMQRELHTLRQQAGLPGPQDLEPLLAAAAAALHASGHPNGPHTLEYDGHTLVLHGLDNAATLATAMNHHLHSNGYHATATDTATIRLHTSNAPRP